MPGNVAWVFLPATPLVLLRASRLAIYDLKRLRQIGPAQTDNGERMTTSKEMRAVARLFNAKRARKNIVRIWKYARFMDTPSVWKAAEEGARCLREAAIMDVRVESLPADGRTSFGGWIIPIAWSVKDARLETAGQGRPVVLVDYARNPQNIALYSPGTRNGGWVEGQVVCGRNLESIKGSFKGKFILLDEGFGSFSLNDAAARKGALGVIGINTAEAPEAAKYVNYAVPLDAYRKCVPCFSLTQSAGRQLRELLKDNPSLRLRARVKARRYKGTMPLLTGSIGTGGPPIYVCGHIDEIGAQDNASGCGVGIEALRILHEIAESRRFAPQTRQIRFFFSVEVRGLQAWFNRQPQMSEFFGGINLDMVGADPILEPARMMIGIGFRHRPHFSTWLIHDAVRIAEKTAGHMYTGTRADFVSDCVLGTPYMGGTVSLEQKTGKTYHSSADTPDILKLSSIKWTGAATSAFLYAMSRIDNNDVLRLAGRIYRKVRRNRRSGSLARTEAQRALIELATLRRALRSSNLYGNMATAEDFYRAGVKRTTGCWPQVEQRELLDSYASEVKRIAGALPLAQTPKPPRVSAAVRNEAHRLVPQALFRAFLSFEDCITQKSRKELKRLTGQEPGWGAGSSIWMLVSCFRGKQSLAEIAESLQELGIAVHLKFAVRLTRYLVKTGKAVLRPVIDRQALRRSFRAAGVKNGMILMVHSSLSKYGYVQGGPETVVRALMDVLGPKGTLAMPTHSNNVLGTRPYIPSTSPSNTGAITEYFRRMPGVLRSAHPTHSVAALGPAARALTGAVRADQAPLARDGFWGKLYDLKGHVLLMCPIRSATIFHVGETWVGLPQDRLVVHASDRRGRRQVYVLPNAPWHVDHFEKTMAAPLIRKGIMKEVRLGDDVIRLAPATAMIDISVRVNRRNPLVSVGKNGACVCRFCTALKQGLAAPMRLPQAN